MTDTKHDARIARLLDRTEIFDLVRTERFYRDQRDWNGLVGSYIKNSPVRRFVRRVPPRRCFFALVEAAE